MSLTVQLCSSFFELGGVLGKVVLQISNAALYFNVPIFQFFNFSCFELEPVFILSLDVFQLVFERLIEIDAAIILYLLLQQNTLSVLHCPFELIYDKGLLINLFGKQFDFLCFNYDFAL